MNPLPRHGAAAASSLKRYIEFGQVPFAPGGMMVSPLPDSRRLVDGAGSASLHEVALVFDARAFRELHKALAGDLDSVVSIYRTFVSTAALLIGSLPARDCATQGRTLHRLKGSAAMVGAERMACLASRLQHVAANSVHSIHKTRIDELTGELGMFCGAVNAHARSCHFCFEIE